MKPRWVPPAVAIVFLSSFAAWAQAPAPPAPAVYAVAYVEVLPASSSAAKTALKEYRAASRADEGAGALDLFERADRPGHFALIETWRDQKAFDAHAMTAHVGRLTAALAPLRVSGYDQRPYKALAVGPSRTAGGGQALHVVTHVDTVPGPQSDGPGLLTRLAEASRKEPGNIRFDVLQHVMRANHFTIVETWEIQRALDAHAGAAHTRQYRDSLQPFSGGPLDERIYKAVE